MEETITAADANRKFSELLRGVREGRSFLVTSHGRPVAKVIPADEDSRSADAGRAALFSRLEKQKPARSAAARRRWTREELYED